MQLPAIANPAQRLPAIAPRPEPITRSEAAAMRQMWKSALVLILEDFGDDHVAARLYLRSRDGRLVMEYAGVDGSRLDKLNLRATYLLSKSEQAEKAKEARDRQAAERLRNRELEQARLARERAEAAERKEAKQRIAEKLYRIREIDRRVAKQKAAQEAPKPHGQLVVIDPGRPAAKPLPPVGRGPAPRPDSLAGRVREFCDKLAARGIAPTAPLLAQAFPDAHKGTLGQQLVRWRKGRLAIEAAPKPIAITDAAREAAQRAADEASARGRAMIELRKANRASRAMENGPKAAGSA